MWLQFSTAYSFHYFHYIYLSSCNHIFGSYWRIFGPISCICGLFSPIWAYLQLFWVYSGPFLAQFGPFGKYVAGFDLWSLFIREPSNHLDLFLKARYVATIYQSTTFQKLTLTFDKQPLLTISPGHLCHLYGKVGNNCKRISDSGILIYGPSLVTY